MMEYKEVLEACGVHFLENETVRFAEYNITLRGLEIPLSCYRRFRKGTLTVEEIIERIGQPDETTYEVLLAHNPTYMETYQKWGADLVLSGHLHGGVVRIPGILGVISPAFELFPKYSGDLYRDGDKNQCCKQRSWNAYISYPSVESGGIYRIAFENL